MLFRRHVPPKLSVRLTIETAFTLCAVNGHIINK